MHLERLYVLLVWSVVYFSSCQGNNKKKKVHFKWLKQKCLQTKPRAPD